MTPDGDSGLSRVGKNLSLPKPQTPKANRREGVRVSRLRPTRVFPRGTVTQHTSKDNPLRALRAHVSGGNRWRCGAKPERISFPRAGQRRRRSTHLARCPPVDPSEDLGPCRALHARCTAVSAQGPTQRIHYLREMNNETTESPPFSPDGKDKQSPPAHATPHGPSWGPSCWVSKPQGGGETPFLSHPSKRHSLLQNAFTGTSVLDPEAGGRGSAGWTRSEPSRWPSGPAGRVTDPRKRAAREPPSRV